MSIDTTCPECGHQYELATNPATEPMYRLAEVAEILGISKRTLMRHVRRRTLRARRMPGRTTPWMVSESDLADFRKRHNL